MSSNSQKDLLQAISSVLRILGIAIEEEAYLQELVEQIGWDLDEIAGFSINQLSQHLQVFVVDLQQLTIELEGNPPQTLEGFARALENVKKLFDDIRGLNVVFNNLDFNPPQLEEFSKDLIEYLAISYIRIRHPILYRFSILLTLIEDGDERPLTDPIFNDQGVLVRFPYRRSQLRSDRLDELLKDPGGLLKQEYFSLNELHTQVDVIRASHKLFPRLDALLSELGFNTVFSHNPAYGIDFGEVGNQIAAGMLTVFLESDIDELEFGVTLALSSTEHGNLGMVVMPFGDIEFSKRFSSWQLYSELTAGVQAFAIGPEGLTLLENSDSVAVEAGFSLVKLPNFDSELAFLVGSTKGSRFEIGQFLFSGTFSVSENEVEVELFTNLHSAALVISSGDGDGFLQNILPSDDIRIDFDIAIVWSNKKGFHIRGNAGLDTTIPIGRTLGGIITIDSIYLAIDTGDESVTNTVAASIQTKIGPVEATLDRIGLEAKIASPEDGGNLGSLNLDFGFKPPTSIGLTINTAGVTGGGFLKIDPPHYAGILLLDVKDKFSIMAIGVLTTELPDGKLGFSMLFQIVAEFSPIQLGLGFALTGVGGMVGINRKLHEKNMRQAIQNHEFDLFPTEEPDFFTIIDTYQSVLPAMKGHHIFGPIVKIHWGGSIKLVEFEVGVFIQLGGPKQVLIVGRAWSVLPDEDTKILVLDFDVFGIIDFGDGRLEIEATLSPGSKFMGYDLDGQMALKADWQGTGKTFVMSVGGFHPRFTQTPVGFPTLRRLQILAKKSGANITLQLYFAITTNSLQFGAKLDILAKKSGFKIAGGGGFDALIIFNPFSFNVLIYFYVRVSKSWFSVGLDLELELSGPNPLRAKGYVKFSYGFGSKKIRFSKQFGEEKTQQLPNASPVDALLTELSNAEHLKFELPSWARAGVIYREGTESMADPLADIIISQEAVPLKVTIDKFGGTRLQASERRLDIKADVAANIVEEVKTLFAPAQFIAMSDDQKLSSPAFTSYKSGLRLKSSYIIPQTSETRELVFETVLRESRLYSPAATNDPANVIKAYFICLWVPDFEEAVSSVANWSLAGASLIHVHTNDNVFEAEDETGAFGFDDSEITVFDNTATHLEALDVYSGTFAVEEEITVTF